MIVNGKHRDLGGGGRAHNVPMFFFFSFYLLWVHCESLTSCICVPCCSCETSGKNNAPPPKGKDLNWEKIGKRSTLQVRTKQSLGSVVLIAPYHGVQLVTGEHTLLIKRVVFLGTGETAKRLKAVAMQAGSHIFKKWGCGGDWMWWHASVIPTLLW